MSVSVNHTSIAEDSKGVNKKRREKLLTRFFTKADVHPYDEIIWQKRKASIKGSAGDAIFEQNDVEVPKFWSQTATDIVAEKYFSGHVGRKGRETSVKQLVDRVVNTITQWGREFNYFVSEDEAAVFNEELKYLVVNQYAAFNSPVWFNVGVEARPQCSACFILSVEDNKESIAEWYKNEMFIFASGSGAGVNVSSLRSSYELIARKGKSSGPVAFMKGADAIAGTIKSGGKTRRAAKMVVMNVDHPDIKDFILCKWREEEKAKRLIAMGHDAALDGDVYNNIFFQNANNSVRVTDEFMRAVERDAGWELKTVCAGETIETVKARDLFHLIAEAAWHCADPGIQFDTVINKWHTCPASGRINASNPCSEYMHLDNSACNLASLNLLKFLKHDGKFDTNAFMHAVRVLIIAQDIIVDGASYPTERIGTNAGEFRALGLGYANLGALLMTLGFPYDSDRGRSYAAALTSLMTGHAYSVSAELSHRVGSFSGFAQNMDPMLKILQMHKDESLKIDKASAPREILKAAGSAWQKAVDKSRKYGVRNSQISLLAPTGTIAFMMDCATTGIEPDFSLVKYKKMVGGGLLKIVNGSVPETLKVLGYSKSEVSDITDYIDEEGSIEGAPHVKNEHLPVFDCATYAPGGTRAIGYLGHVRMMAAVQPFLSGAISKTVNMPSTVTIEDIEDAYMQAWKLGLKSVAIYRDGSKGVQPLNTTLETKTDGKSSTEVGERPARKYLPTDVQSFRHKFSIMGHEGYIHYGVYKDGKLGEIFIRMAKEGSTISGLLDALGILMSVALQYGVPAQVIVRKLIHARFEPAGYTENSEIPIAKSILDYIAKFLAMRFLSEEEQASFGIYVAKQNDAGESDEGETQQSAPQRLPSLAAVIASYQDAPACRCGSIMVRTGSCYTCPSCGENLGSCS